MEGGDKEDDFPDTIRDVDLFNWHPDVVMFLGGLILAAGMVDGEFSCGICGCSE